jgi:hypothetical protein
LERVASGDACAGDAARSRLEVLFAVTAFARRLVARSGLLRGRDRLEESVADFEGVMSASTDFDFLHHNWRVRHRKLKTRLVGAGDWVEFDGTSTTRPILDGHGNVEDNFLDDPSGAYRAAALRGFDERTGLWRIWWLDLRFPDAIGAPVVGGFDGDLGTFVTDENWEGRPIKLRFIWRKNGGDGPVWEQAFSPDAGANWEVNWVMRFTRA